MIKLSVIFPPGHIAAPLSIEIDDRISSSGTAQSYAPPTGPGVMSSPPAVSRRTVGSAMSR
jgi:hypothetical protein